MRNIYFNMNTKERRAAIVEHGEVVEFMIERPVEKRIVGNIYLARVVNVLPGMQAAFVDIGREKNGFIYRDDLLSFHLLEEEDEKKKKRSISEFVTQGEELLVQVTKEGFGTKGPRLTSLISLPGRYVVYLPEGGYVGVSRRFSSEDERERLRGIGENLLQDNEGVIIRTICEGLSAEELKQELHFLRAFWAELRQDLVEKKAPSLLHQDSGLFERIVRDFAHHSIGEIVIDHLPDYKRLKLLFESYPHLGNALRLYHGKENIFEAFGVEKELEKALKRQVWLKNGAYLMIDQTEALTVVDVNTGKFTGKTNLEDTILKTNIEATKEIANQLRLRDISGIIVIDFIDMKKEEHKEAVLKAFKKALKSDRTKTNVVGMSGLGLVEMTRKKVRNNLQASLSKTCPTCHGKGSVLSDEAQAFKIERLLWEYKGGDQEAIVIEIPSKVQTVLLGEKGQHLKRLEEALAYRILIYPNKAMNEEAFSIRYSGTLEEAAHRLEQLKKSK
ncbi:Rne/Rng family ribonuclease [Alkalihalobacillus sp. 1P02AB]|uniref:Rne/Rng family ribonuclease n=1 Tax=Alkalihalobacillus sp. 1P02AB TaxID=3132260 RepID=UPI0039A62DE2